MKNLCPKIRVAILMNIFECTVSVVAVTLFTFPRKKLLNARSSIVVYTAPMVCAYILFNDRKWDDMYNTHTHMHS